MILRRHLVVDVGSCIFFILERVVINNLESFNGSMGCKECSRSFSHHFYILFLTVSDEDYSGVNERMFFQIIPLDYVGKRFE
jgi:hypothetical protein